MTDYCWASAAAGEEARRLGQLDDMEAAFERAVSGEAEDLLKIKVEELIDLDDTGTVLDVVDRIATAMVIASKGEAG